MRFIFLSLLMSSLLLSKSNILIITIDDLKPALGCYGDELAISPEIDSLARSGTLFNAAYCQQAVCAPSRISMYTGLRPDSTGILNLHTYMRDINPDVITLPQFFRDQDYVTVGYGKLLHGAKNDDQKKSWTELGRDLPYNDSVNPPILEKFQDSETRKVFDKLLSENKNLKNSLLVKKLKENNVYPVSEALEIPDDAYRDGAVAKLGVKRLREFKQSKEKFLMVLGFNKPHLPFSAPKKYWDLHTPSKFQLAPYTKQDNKRPKYAYHSYGELGAYTGFEIGGAVSEEQQRHLIHAYYACVSYVDAQVGKVLKELKKLDLDKETIVVLWGDHGWHLGDHGIWCKHSNFEQATRAPLIISVPGYKSGNVSNSAVEFIDIFPTLCELVNNKIPEFLQGRSLLPLLNNPLSEVKTYAISQYKRWASHGYSMRKGSYRLTLWMPKNYYSFQKFNEQDIQEMELYDYKKDPHEINNLVNNPEYDSVLSDMKRSFKEFFDDQFDQEKAQRLPSLIKEFSRKKF